ncbi:hypothetical protein MMC27_000935 [Xylographa pallens]|nr:hypothetical protein [Xylographa pallens]
MRRLPKHWRMTTRIATGEAENKIWMNSVPSKTATENISDSGDASSDLDRPIDLAETWTSDILQGFLSIKGAITNLFKLSKVVENIPMKNDFLGLNSDPPFSMSDVSAQKMDTPLPDKTVRNIFDKTGPAVAGRNSQAKKTKEKNNVDLQSSVLLSQRKRERDALSLVGSFPAANETKPWLIKRLIHAIILRERHLQYLAQHYIQVQAKASLKPADLQTFDMPQATNSPNRMDDLPQDVLGQTHAVENKAQSYDSSTSDESAGADLGASGILKVPQLPQAPGETPKNRTAWRRHVYSDLKPYLCTNKDCDFLAFSSRREWFDHELKVHRKIWTCIYCYEEPYQDQKTFVSHLQIEHGERFTVRSRHLTNLQLQAIVIRCEHNEDRVYQHGCPLLCSDWPKILLKAHTELVKADQRPAGSVPYGSMKQLRQHVGHHMEQFTLLSLSYFDSTTNSSFKTQGMHDSSEAADDTNLVAIFSAMPEHSPTATLFEVGDVRQADSGRVKYNRKVDNIRRDQYDEYIVKRPHWKTTRIREPVRDLNEYFVDGDGISREVLQMDICKYLGLEATSRPGEYHSKRGYFVKAVRAFTPEQLEDLRRSSKLSMFGVREGPKYEDRQTEYPRAMTRPGVMPLIHPSPYHFDNFSGPRPTTTQPRTSLSPSTSASAFYDEARSPYYGGYVLPRSSDKDAKSEELSAHTSQTPQHPPQGGSCSEQKLVFEGWIRSADATSMLGALRLLVLHGFTCVMAAGKDMGLEMREGLRGEIGEAVRAWVADTTKMGV